MDSRKVRISDLPIKVLQRILSFLPDLGYRRMFSLVCRQWNDLAFDYHYLGHIRLNFKLDDDSMIETAEGLSYSSRPYRIVTLTYCFRRSLGESEIWLILKLLENLSLYLEELVCCGPNTPDFMALKLFYLCPLAKKLQFVWPIIVPDNKLKVRNNLEELIVTKRSRINIIQLAPNLRRLQTRDDLYDLPNIIQKLPLEHLRVNFESGYVNVFQRCAEETKLTSVDLRSGAIDQQGLEELCKLCPLLAKLQINVTRVTSLRCLASLSHLKVLALEDLFDYESIFGYGCFSLPNVKIVAFIVPRDMRFYDGYLKETFPNVHSFKFVCDDPEYIDGKISDGFPKLQTLEVDSFSSAVRLNLLKGLSDLRELIWTNSLLWDSQLPPMNVQQLTLKYSEFRVTSRMTHLPNLQFLNLYGVSSCNTEKLPPSCSVRSSFHNESNDIFDIK